jgi:hypothetical protein
MAPLLRPAASSTSSPASASFSPTARPAAPTSGGRWVGAGRAMSRQADGCQLWRARAVQSAVLAGSDRRQPPARRAACAHLAGCGADALLDALRRARERALGGVAGVARGLARAVRRGVGRDGGLGGSGGKGQGQAGRRAGKRVSTIQGCTPGRSTRLNRLGRQAYSNKCGSTRVKLGPPWRPRGAPCRWPWWPRAPRPRRPPGVGWG